MRPMRFVELEASGHAVSAPRGGIQRVTLEALAEQRTARARRIAGWRCPGIGSRSANRAGVATRARTGRFTSAALMR